VLVRLQEGRGVVRFAFAGVAAASDRAASAAPAEHAACAVRAVCDVRAAAQRVRLSVKDDVRATRVAVKAMRAAHVCYVVVFGVVVLREKAQYLREGRAPCASTLWRQRRSPLLPTSLPWPRQNSRA
jgi:negative regulator of sigma E activity